MHNAEPAFQLFAPKKPDVILMGGDLTNGIRKDAFTYYQRLVHKYFGAEIPVSAACAGNHDYLCAEKRPCLAEKTRFGSSDRQKNADFSIFF